MNLKVDTIFHQPSMEQRMLREVGSSSRAHAPPPRRSWPHLRHRHSSPSILGFVGPHHAHTAPAGAPTSNSSSPATPSRSPRNPIHPGSVGLECDGTDKHVLTEAMRDSEQQDTEEVGRIAGIWSKRDGGESSAGVWTGLGLEHGLLPGVAILVRGAVVRGLAVLVVWSPEQGLPRRGMRSRGVGVVQVLGRARSMRPGRGFTGERGPFGTSCSSSLSGRRSPGDKQHPT